MAAVAAAASAPAAGTVAIKTFRFQPEHIEVRAGTAITWNNRDTVEHTVTGGTSGAPSGVFDTGAIGRGGSARILFAQPGRYTYFCARHPSMQGSITVLPGG